MALAHSPKIVTKDLEFYYDMGNPQKSWKGQPTTNLYWANTGTNINNYNGWGMPGVPGAASAIVTDYGSWNGNTIWKVTAGIGTVEGFASWRQCLPTGYDSTYGTTRRMNAKVKMLKGSVTDLGLHTGGGTSSFTYTAISPLEVPDTIGDKTGWYLLDANVSGTYPFGHCVGIGILSQDIEFLVAEPGVYPSAVFTEYTPTNRTNTQAILDMVGDNTITANELTYNSDGTFNFTSASNYASVAYNTKLDLINEVTLEAWLKYTTSENTVCIEKSNNNSHYQFQVFSDAQGSGIGGDMVFMLQPNASNWVTAGMALNDNNWHHVVGTYDRDISTAKIYVDGVLKNTNSSITTGPYTNTQPLLIGSRSGIAGFGGSIPHVKIYSRALTSAEVKENFNALRGRFGI